MSRSSGEELLQSWYSQLSSDLYQPSEYQPPELRQSDVTVSASSHQDIAEVDAVSPPTDFAVEPSPLLSVSKSAMACEFEVLLNRGQYPKGVENAVGCLELIEKLEQLFSIYVPRSELSQVNRFGGQRPVQVSVDTANLLRVALDIGQLTGGTFDITAGSLSAAWGFARRKGCMPSSAQISQALQLVGQDQVSLDSVNRTASLMTEGATLNPGAIGKGYALDRATAHLTANGIAHLMIHGGLSSIVARGNRADGTDGAGWLVALKHPWRVEQTIGSIRLVDQALATSGSGKQFFHFQGKRYSHLIDPRSGWPAQSMMSATVICPSATIADALATALFIMGPEEATQFCARHQSVSAVLVFADNKTGRMSIEVCNLPSENWHCQI